MAICDPRDIYPGGYPSDKFDMSGFVVGTGLTMSNVYGSAALDLDLENNKEFQEIKTRISAMEDQLMILRPDLAMQEKYPALKEAYDAYQLILKMVKDNNSGNK